VLGAYPALELIKWARIVSSSTEQVVQKCKCQQERERQKRRYRERELLALFRQLRRAGGSYVSQRRKGRA